MIFEDLKYIDMPLPEDIQRYKAIGDFDKAIEIIDRRLAKELPVALAKRLEFEKHLFSLYRLYYIYTFEEAYELAKSKIRDFSEAELQALIDENKVEWMYIDREVHIINTFCDNLIKTVADIENRQFEKAETKNEGEHDSLDEIVSAMKAKGSLTYKIRLKHSLKINEEAQRVGDDVVVHLPIPTKSRQLRNLNILEINPEPTHIADLEYPCRTVSFNCKLQKDQIFSVEYEYENHIDYIELDADNNEASDKQPTFETSEVAPHIVFTPYLRALYEEIVGDATNPIKKARLIYNFITTKVNYSYMRRYLSITNIPEFAAINLKGDCGVQALLFITLCRLGGIPARWQAGLYTSPDHCGNHDWAEFYVAPYGWLFADLSFGGSSYRKGKIERWNFYFGNLDTFRMPATQQFQCQFDPPMKNLRQDPYDNQCGEVEYVDRSLDREEYIADKSVLILEEI